MRWCFVLLAACGAEGLGPEDVSSDNRSGERLKLTWLEYEGGARELGQFPQLFDSEHGLPCVPRPLADGSTRCLPHLPAQFPGVVYTDPFCREPLGEGASDAPLYYDHPTPEGFTRIMRRGEVTEPPGEVFDRVAGTCIGPRVPIGDLEYVALAGEVEFDELVAVREVQLPSTGRIAHLALQGDDGLVMHRGLFDRELEVTCAAQRTPDGAECVPTEHTVLAPSLFGDTACTSPVAVAEPTTRFIAVRQPDSCLPMFHLGPPTAGPIFELRGGACIPATRVPNGQLFAAGPPLDLAPLERRVTELGRIHEISYASGALVTPALELHDTTFGTSCTIDGFRGLERCLPRFESALTYFVEDQCETQAAVAIVTSTPPVCADEHRIATDLGEPLFEILDEVAMPFESPELLACEPAPELVDFEYRRLGREVSFEEFAAAARVRDP